MTRVLTFRYRVVKRLLDLLLVAALLPFCVLLGLFIVLLIRLTSRGSVFYREYRIGRGGQRFRIWKFRTMYVGAERKRRLERTEHSELHLRSTHKRHGDPRVTLIGKWLRLWSLDEIPQIINIIADDMSWIGPRPIVDAERPFYGDSFDVYCMTKPGLSGLWQISGRSNTTYEDRVRLDCCYVNGWSLRLDTKILLKTLHVVVRADGSC